MFVLKRDGRQEAVKFDKITARIQKLCYGLDALVDPTTVAMKVIEGIYENVTTFELDNLAAEVSASLTVKHPDYAQLAARIAVSNLHKKTKKSFSETMTDLYEYVNPITSQQAPLLADDVYEIIQEHKEVLDSHHHIRPGFRLRLILGVKTLRAIVPHCEWKGADCRATTAHVDAGLYRDSQRGY